MKVLSLRQPWAALVVIYGKDIENRKWNTKYRGHFYIHAAAGMTRHGFDDALSFARQTMGDRAPTEMALRSMLNFGGIIGMAKLVDVLTPCTDDRSIAICDRHPWHIPWQYGFKLEDMRPVDFHPMKGQLGFFDLRRRDE